MVIELAIYSSSDMEVEELLTQVLETGKMSILKVWLEEVFTKLI